ncbi:MAG: class I SAM-dependent methyltransferase [Candidatus Rokubacteria bacterium]|nr:class I SAM-dependent methyltransferase [Candidatus Rokubacteria bacterium]
MNGPPESVRYGKPIDYSRLKPRVMADVRATIERIRALAEHFRPRAVRELDACPLCDAKDIHPYVHVFGYPYYRCERCSLVFLQRRLSPEALIAYWREGSTSDTYADPETYRYRREQVARPKVDFVLGQWSGARGRWLDLGAGIGDTVSLVSEHGWQGVGLEVSATCRAFARDVLGVDLLDQPIQEHARVVEPGHYDVVSAIGYLEHVDRPAEEIGLAARVLRAGGLFLMFNPNWQSLSMALAQKNPDNLYRFIHPPASTHVYSEATHEFICREFGFRMRAQWFFGMDAFELLNQLVSLGRLEPDSAEYRALHSSISEIQLAIDRMRTCDYIHVLLEKR